MNWTALLLAAVIPMVIGFIWYNPKVLGSAWMRETGLKQEELEKGSMIATMAFAFLFSFFLSFIMQMIVIHQFGAMGMVGGDPTKALPSYAAFMSDYGTAFRTFKHGALHGTMAGLFFAMPIIAINSLFEKRSWKYIFIHVGYWIITLALMGGTICAM